MLWLTYLGFAVCFYLGRLYELEKQKDFRRRGTTYKVPRRAHEQQ